MNRNFRELLEARWSEGKFVCVGLDSEFGRIPHSAHKYDYHNTTDVVGNVNGHTKHLNIPETIVAFNRTIVETTRDLVCAFKPNFAFYGGEWIAGFVALERTVRYIHHIAPDVPIILDAKVGDIGNTNMGYVRMAFDQLGVDAITVHPYLGEEALRPFLDRKDKGIIVLCRTSNPGAGEFQDSVVSVPDATENGDRSLPLYMRVAERVKYHWNANGNCGLVVGATRSEELAKVRRLMGDGFPILIPGIGAQGGDLEATVQAGRDSRDRGMIINSSRGIIFADDPRRETQKLHDQIGACLTPVGS